MNMEGSDQAGRDLAVEAMAAQGALREISTVRRSDWYGGEMAPNGSAMRGLAVAVPMALALWMTIGMLLWALLR
jgi:hypothetical protein